MRRWLLVAAAVVLAGAAAAGAWQAASTPGPQTREAEVAEIASGLRCPTCQGLSVADSPSPVAEGMREVIAEQLAAGRSREEIRAWFVERYGTWVLLSPEPGGLGWLAWTLPLVVLVGGAGGALVFLRRRREQPPPVTAAQAARAEQALAEHRAGGLAPPQTSAGERLAAALALLEAVRDERESEPAGGAAEQRALARVAAALEAREREASAAPVAAHAGPATGRGASPAAGEQHEEVVQSAEMRPAAPAQRARRPGLGARFAGRRGLAWLGGAAVFLGAATALLVASVGPRGEDGLPTGGLPERPALEAAEEPVEGEELAALRAEVREDPDDVRARLLLAVTLLRTGELDEAREHADAAAARAGDDPDVLLVLGLVQSAEGDPAAGETLARFLEVAGEDHPGRALVEEAVEGEGAGGAP